MTSLSNFAAIKEHLRTEMRARRNALPTDERIELSRKICSHLCEFEASKNAQNIALYLATRHEANLDEAISHFLIDKTVAVPAVGLKPRFAILSSLDDVKTNARGLRIPRATNEIRERGTAQKEVAESENLGSENDEEKSVNRKIAAHEVEVVVVPALAFDELGNRLGQGGGWYDRVLDRDREKREKLCLTPLVVVGVGFGFQLVESVPTEPHDAHLDFLVTENGVHRVLENAEKGA